jgi:hypothetical protein
MSTMVSQNELSRRVGVSRTRLRQYEAEGRISRDAACRYDLQAVKHFLATGIDHERRAARLGAGGPLGGKASAARLVAMAYRAKSLEHDYKALAASVIARATAQATADGIADVIESKLSHWTPALLAHTDDKGREAIRRDVEATMTELVDDLRCLPAFRPS